MSKSAPPPPKQSLAQTLLTIAVLFLGFQLFMQASKTPPDPRTPEQLLTELRKANAKVLDVTGAELLSRHYLPKLAQQQLPEDQRLAKEIEAAVLVADAQLKGGLGLNDLNRISAAYNLLQPYSKRYSDNPAWTKALVDVADDPTYGTGDTTGAALYSRVVETLSQKNRQALAWGFAPGWQIMDALVSLTGKLPAFSYAFAAFVLAVIVRGIVFPIAQRQMMHSRQLSQLMPLVAEVREKYKGDAQQQSVKTMELYREYGINPMAGCFPALIQLPLFILVYQFMLQYQFEFQKGTFLWINPATSAATDGFIAPNLGQMDYVLLVLYGISMIATALLMPVADPAQARQQRIMGVAMSGFMAVIMFFYPLPSAFVLYWIFTNILSTAQALRAYRLPLQPLVKVATPAGGVFPSSPFFRNAATGDGQAMKGDGKLNGQTKTGRPAKHKPKKRK